MSFSEIKPRVPMTALKAPIKFGIRVGVAGRVVGRIVLSPDFCKEHGITDKTRFRVLAGHAENQGKLRFQPTKEGEFKAVFMKGAAMISVGVLPGMSKITTKSKPCDFEQNNEGLFLVTLPRFLFFDEDEDEAAPSPAPAAAPARVPKNRAGSPSLSDNQEALLQAIRRLHEEGVQDMLWGLLAKESGVPKGSLSVTLQALADKGAIRRQATLTGVVYLPSGETA